MFDADHSCRSCQANVEIIPIRRINETYERGAKADGKYRFTLDMASQKP